MADTALSYADLLDHLGTENFTQSKYDEAIQCFTQARDLYHDGGNDINALRSEYKVGLTYIQLKQFKQSIEILIPCSRLCIEHGELILQARCDGRIGASFLELNQYEDAIPYFKTASEIFYTQAMKEEAVGNEYNLAIAYINLGAFFLCQKPAISNYKAAVENFTQARTYFLKGKHEADVAHCDLGSGVAYKRLKDYQRALSLIESAKKTYGAHSNDGGLAQCNLELGEIHSGMMNHQDATESFIAAKEFFVRQYREVDAARCDREQAVLSTNRNQYGRAIELFDAAREIFLGNHMAYDAAQCDRGAGVAYLNLGQYGKAIELLESASAVFRAHDHYSSALADCELYLGGSSHALGQYDIALQKIDLARELYRADFDERGIAICDYTAGQVYADLSETDKALKYYSFAEKIFDQVDSPDWLGRCIDARAKIYAQTDEAKKEIEARLQAKDIFDKLGLQVNAADAAINIVAWYVHSELVDHKAEHRDFALMQELCDAGIFMDATEEGKSYVHPFTNVMNMWNDARNVFFAEGMHEKVSYCDYLMAKAFLHVELFDQALARLNQAFQNIDATSSPVLLVACHRVASSIYAGKGQWGLTRHHLQEAIDIIRRQKTSLFKDETKTAVLGRALAVYEAMIRLCLYEGNVEGALEYLEETKSQNLAEKLLQRDLKPQNTPTELVREYEQCRFKMRKYSFQLSKEDKSERLAELEKEYEVVERGVRGVIQEIRGKYDPDFDPFPHTRITFPDIRTLVTHEDEAIVWLLPTEGITLLFVLRAGGCLQATEVADFTSLDLRELFKKNAVLDQVLGELYKRVFLKIRNQLDGIQRIIFVPYAGFHLLPLQAMHYEDEGGNRRYLIDDYAVTTVPSALTLQECQKGKKNGQHEYPRVVILHANPVTQADLPHARQEADFLQEIFPNARHRSSITRKDLLELGPQADILHYSGHASTSALFLNDGLFFMEDIYEHVRLPKGSLAVLSACDTGKTYLKRVDEFVGLSAAFHHAGAVGCIASIWPVDDAAARLLMTRMYNLIKAEVSPAEALRGAQLWLKDP